MSKITFYSGHWQVLNFAERSQSAYWLGSSPKLISIFLCLPQLSWEGIKLTKLSLVLVGITLYAYFGPWNWIFCICIQISAFDHIDSVFFLFQFFCGLDNSLISDNPNVQFLWLICLATYWFLLSLKLMYLSEIKNFYLISPSFQIIYGEYNQIMILN